MAAPSTRLRVRVSPGARRGGVAGRVGEVWKLRVTAPAEGGRANEAVVRLLVTTLAVAIGVTVLLAVLAEYHAFQANASQACW